MLMPKKNRYLIYEYLFKEGVLVAKKDFHLPKHPELDVPNLQVIKTLQVQQFIFYSKINLESFLFKIWVNFLLINFNNFDWVSKIGIGLVFLPTEF